MRYESDEDVVVNPEAGDYVTNTYCIEAITGEGADAEVVYRFADFKGGGFISNQRVRIPLKLFEQLARENHAYFWERHEPAGTETEEFGEGKMTLSVFKKTENIPTEFGGGALESTYYRNADIPITNLFREVSTGPRGTVTKELIEFGREIDEDVYPEILPDDPIDVTEWLLPVLKQALAK